MSLIYFGAHTKNNTDCFKSLAYLAEYGVNKEIIKNLTNCLKIDSLYFEYNTYIKSSILLYFEPCYSKVDDQIYITL